MSSLDYDSLVARLTDAVDNGAIDGDATAPDEGVAKRVLDELVASHRSNNAHPVANTDDYSARYAEWEADVENAYKAYDRAVRSLMTLVRQVAHRTPLGAIANAAIAALDPSTPLPVPDAAALDSIANRVSDLGRLLERELTQYSPQLRSFDPAIESANNCCRAYVSVRQHPPERRWGAQSSAVAVAAYVNGERYNAALAAAARFVDYLDARSTPVGVR